MVITTTNQNTWDRRICDKCGGSSYMPKYKKGFFGKEWLQYECRICGCTWKEPTLQNVDTEEKRGDAEFRDETFDIIKDFGRK